jgi:transposase
VAIADRGRSVREGRTLSAEQEKTLRKMISDRTPDLWTRSAVRDLVHQQFGIRWGFISLVRHARNDS